MLVAGAWLASCGCDDIGCPERVVVVSAGELSVQQLALSTPNGWVECPSTSGACSRITLDDGRSEFRFNVSATSKIEVRAKNAADVTVFEGELPLTLEQVKHDPDACESTCPQGRASLPNE